MASVETNISRAHLLDRIERNGCMSKRLLQNLVLAGLSTALSMCALELGIRWFNPPFEPRTLKVYASHPALGHVMRPGVTKRYRTQEFETVIRTNSEGFRGRDYGPKGASGFRIVVVGDSFTFGAEVDEGDTFLSLLETMLNGRADTVFCEVINLGIRAYGTQQEMLTLRQKGLSHEPDVVILQLFTGNDLYENPPRIIPYAVVNGSLVPPVDPTASHVPARLDEWLSEHSSLYLLGRDRYQGLMERWRSHAGDERNLRIMKYATQPYAVIESPEMRYRWAVVDNLLRELAELSERHGFRVFLMDVPLRERLDPDVFESWGLDAALFDPFKPEGKLRVMAERYGFTLVPMYSAFSTASRTKEDRLYYPKDGHWTPAGHRLAAQLLYDAIAQQGLP